MAVLPFANLSGDPQQDYFSDGITEDLRLPNMQVSHLRLATAYAQLGQLEEARKEAAEVLRINPGFTIQGYKRNLLYKAPKDAEHRIDGMRKAGLPET